MLFVAPTQSSAWIMLVFDRVQVDEVQGILTRHHPVASTEDRILERQYKRSVMVLSLLQLLSCYLFLLSFSFSYGCARLLTSSHIFSSMGICRQGTWFLKGIRYGQGLGRARIDEDLEWDPEWDGSTWIQKGFGMHAGLQRASNIDKDQDLGFQGGSIQILGALAKRSTQQFSGRGSFALNRWIMYTRFSIHTKANHLKMSLRYGTNHDFDPFLHSLSLQCPISSRVFCLQLSRDMSDLLHGQRNPNACFQQWFFWGYLRLSSTHGWLP